MTSAAPNLGSLLTVAARIDRGVQAGAAPGRVLQDALNTLLASLPNGHFAHLFTAGSGIFTLEAASGSEITPGTREASLVLAEDVLFQAATQQNHVAHDPEDGRFAVVLHTGTAMFGILEVGIEPDTYDAEVLKDWLQLAAQHFTLALLTLDARLTESARRDAHLLNPSSSYVEIVTIVQEALGADAGVVWLLVMDDDLAVNADPHFRLVATSTDGEATNLDIVLKRTPHSTLGAVALQTEPQIIPNTRSLDDNIAADLTSLGIQSLLSFPLRVEDDILGAVLYTSPRAAHFNPRQIRILAAVAEEISMVLHNRSLIFRSSAARDLMRRQALAATELTGGSDFRDMASVIGRHMLTNPDHFISINLFEFNAEGEVAEIRTVASARSWGAQEGGGVLPITQEDFGPLLWSSLERRSSLLIENVQENTDLSARFRQWLAVYEVHALYSLPMQIDGRVFGMLALNSITTLPLSEYEMLAYQSLADQLGALIQVRNLLEESRTARDIAGGLVLANRLVTTAEHHSGMAQAVMLTIGKALSAVNVCMMNANGRMVVGTALVDGKTLDNSNHLYPLPPDRYIQDISSGKPLVLLNAAESTYLSPSERSLLMNHGWNWMAVFGLRVGSDLIGTLELLRNEPYSLSSDEFDAYATLADQIAVAIHNRQLLSAAQSAEALAAQLVQTSRRIATAENSSDLAMAVVNAMPGNVPCVAIGLFDRPVSPGEMPSTFHVEALASHAGVVEPGIRDRITAGERSLELVQRLSMGEVIVFDDLAHLSSTLMPNTFNLLREQEIMTIVNVGLRIGSRLLGSVILGGELGMMVSPAQMNNFLTIADQVAIAIENQVLLQDTAISLEETGLLYRASRAMMEAQDTPDVLRALKDHLASDALFIAHQTIEYDDNGRMKTIWLEHQLDSQGNLSVPHVPMRIYTSETLADLHMIWNIDRQEMDVVANTESSNDETMAAGLRALGVRSSITLPIRESGVVQELINISFSEPREFSTDTLRLYEAMRDQLVVVRQKQRLLQSTQTSAEQLRSQVAVLEAINRIAATVNTARDEVTLITEALELMVSALGIDHAGAMMLDSTGEFGTVTAEYPSMNLVGQKIDLRNHPRRVELFDELKTVTMNDISTSPMIDEVYRSTLLASGIQGLSVIPLVVQDKAIGSIGLDMLSPNRRFSESMVEAAKTMTAQISLGVQNVRLLTGMQWQANQLARIAEFSQAVLASLRMDEILRIVLDQIPRIVVADFVMVMTYDLATGMLRMAAIHDMINGLQQVDEESAIIFSPEDTEVGLVLTNQGVHYLDDLSNHATPEVMLMREAGMGSGLIAPILARGRAMGVLCIARQISSGYSETDSVVMQQIAGQVGIAMENAEAYFTTQRRANNEALVNNISSQLQRRTDIDSMLNTTMQELGRALGARRARIRLGVQTPGSESN